MGDKYTIGDAPAAPASKYTVGDAAPTPPQPGIMSQLGDWWENATKPVTEIRPHNMQSLLGTNGEAPTASQVGHELVTGLGNIGAGGLGVLLHPLDTLKSIGMTALHASPPGELIDTLRGQPTATEQFAQQAVHQPLETAESGVGQAGALPILEGAVKAPIKAVRAIPRVARGGANIIAGTGPGVAEDLAADTQTANAAAQADAQAKNAKIMSDRAKQLQQHFEQTQAVRQEPTPGLTEPKVRTPQEMQSRKAALNRGVEQLDPKFQSDLQTTEKNVRAQAGANYDAVRAATAGETVPLSSLSDAVKSAEGLIEGSSENLKVFRDILSKAPEGDDFVVSGGQKFGPGTPLYESVKASPEGIPGASAPATFSDLQGYYTELGSQLSKGNLPADVYRATKALQGSIGDLMQQMAESKGVGDQLTQARKFYSDYMDAFRDHSSPLYKAMNATERGKSIAALKGADQAGIQVLARYNPELAQRANTIRGYQAEAKSISSRTPTIKPEPTLSPAKPPVLADVKKVGLGDIQNAKAEALQNRADALAKKASLVSGGFGGYELLRGAMHGSPTAMLLGAGEIATPYALSKVITSPIIERWLTRPTPADIASIPPDIRGDLPQIVKAAQAQGITVHPAILSLAGVTQRAQ